MHDEPRKSSCSVPAACAPADDAELDAQVVLQELHRIRAVGHDPADLGGGQYHGVRADLLEIRPGPRGVAQVEEVAAAGEHLVPVVGEAAGHRRADQAAVSRDEYAGAGPQ